MLVPFALVASFSCYGIANMQTLHITFPMRTPQHTTAQHTTITSIPVVLAQQLYGGRASIAAQFDQSLYGCQWNEEIRASGRALELFVRQHVRSVHGYEYGRYDYDVVVVFKLLLC